MFFFDQLGQGSIKLIAKALIATELAVEVAAGHPAGQEVEARLPAHPPVGLSAEQCAHPESFICTGKVQR